MVNGGSTGCLVFRCTPVKVTICNKFERYKEQNLWVASVVGVGRTRIWGLSCCAFYVGRQRRARTAPTPRPPAEERNAAPQTPLRKVRLVSGMTRFALVLGLWIVGVG